MTAAYEARLLNSGQLFVHPQARPHMSLSTVVDGKGGSIPSNVRTSSGTFLPQAYDAVVRRIEKRVAFVTQLPAGAYPCSRHQDRGMAASGTHL